MTSGSDLTHVSDLKVSIVIPMYNEESNVEPMTRAVHDTFTNYSKVTG